MSARRLAEAVERLADSVPGGQLLSCTGGGGPLLVAAAELIDELRAERDAARAEVARLREALGALEVAARDVGSRVRLEDK